MTDDIVKRLRRDLASGLSASIGDTEEAADEIERFRSYFDAHSATIQKQADEIERLRVVLRKISRERTLWGAMRKAQHALGDFD